MIHILSSIATCFRPISIGTKVSMPPSDFMSVVQDLLEKHDTSNDRAEGQHFLMLPKETLKYILCGLGPRSENPDDFIMREHRGVVKAYLKRSFAPEPTGAAAIIYTKEACLVDEDVKKEGLLDEVESVDASHILIAVLSFPKGCPSFINAGRLVSNIAGGNKEFDVLGITKKKFFEWQKENGPGCHGDTKNALNVQLGILEEECRNIVKACKESKAGSEAWCTVTCEDPAPEEEKSEE